MVSKTYTVAFEGVEARKVEVQCSLTPGVPSFAIVGLPDKAVSEARDRIRSALTALGIALPARKITINLSPADIPKEGSHFDLPIACAILAETQMIPADAAESILSVGEMSLDGGLLAIPGALPAALAASTHDLKLLCAKENGPESAWVDDVEVLAARDLNEVIRHFTAQSRLPAAVAGPAQEPKSTKDFAEVKGQERSKRALEIAAAGRHHVMMVGAPGSGKSMLASRLPGILPPMDSRETLETSMIHSVSGLIEDGRLTRDRPFRAPHHTASMAAIVGGGRRAKPGEVSLAHNGVLFLDELPEFSRNVLDTLRQPVETGEVMVSRVNAHVRYPCRFLLVAAANPCRCGYLADAARACARVPQCGEDYMSKISGPMLDRFDLRVDVPPVAFQDLDRPANGEPSAVIAARVQRARDVQADRYASMSDCWQNADAEGAVLEKFATPDAGGKELLSRAADKFRLTARGYYRVLRVARTLADLDGSDTVNRVHIGEALSFRLMMARAD